MNYTCPRCGCLQSMDHPSAPFFGLFDLVKFRAYKDYRNYGSDGELADAALMHIMNTANNMAMYYGHVPHYMRSITPESSYVKAELSASASTGVEAEAGFACPSSQQPLLQLTPALK